MQSRSREIITAVRRLYRGVSQIKSKIENDFLPSTKDNVIKTDKLKEKIIAEVIYEYKIPFSSILKNHSEAIRAKTLLIILFHKHLGLSQAEIANLLHVTISLISYRLQAFKNAKIKNKKIASKQVSDNKMFYEKEFMNNYRKINEAISQYKKILWQKKK